MEYQCVAITEHYDLDGNRRRCARIGRLSTPEEANDATDKRWTLARQSKWTKARIEIVRELMYRIPLCVQHGHMVEELLMQQLELYREYENERRRAAEAEEAERRKDEAIVYYVRMPNGNIKIGTTTRPDSRFRSLQGYGEPIQVLATHSGDRFDEDRIHRQFNHLRIDKRELFTPGEDLMQHINDIIIKQSERAS